MDYFEVYRVVWNFHKKYIDQISDSEELWATIKGESEEIIRRYNGCEFVRNLLVNEIVEFDRIYREMIANADRRV